MYTVLRLLMMDSKSVWKMQSSFTKESWEILHLVGFYCKNSNNLSKHMNFHQCAPFFLLWDCPLSSMIIIKTLFSVMLGPLWHWEPEFGGYRCDSSDSCLSTLHYFNLLFLFTKYTADAWSQNTTILYNSRW